jgi:23S rRNA (uracil1939-C5)-methyltransferase
VIPHEDGKQQSRTTPREVTIEKWVYGGAGLARPEGQVTLVPFTLPGETVKIEALRTKASMVEGRVVELVSRAEERVQPKCKYFGKCGGCDYQHAPYEYQVARKVEILREVFRRVGKLDAPEEIATIAGEPWGYRNRTQFHMRGEKIGYLMAGSHELVPVEECPISSPQINEALRAIKGVTRHRRWPRFIREIELFSNGEQVMANVLETEGNQRIAKSFFEWLGGKISGAAAGELMYPTASGPYRVSHGSFFQVNRFLVDQLSAAAMPQEGGETALDLYAGVGLFTIPLAKKFARVVAVETSAQAVRDLEFNTSQAGLLVESHRLQSEQYLDGLTKAPDFVLADPPRSGLGKSVVASLLRLKPSRLTVVSCDPGTLARDAAGLCSSGYKLTKLTLVDLFPQTYHIESVAEFSL